MTITDGTDDSLAEDSVTGTATDAPARATGRVPGTATESTTGSETGKAPLRPPEIGGRKGPEPTRYGDWEKDGLISDF